MKTFNTDITYNPVFNTVNGLSNKTFDPENIVSGRGATEDQLKTVGDVIVELKAYIDEYGCQDDPYQGIRDFLDRLQTQQTECCQNRVTPENLEGLISELRDKIQELEAQIEECCSKGIPGEESVSPSTNCDGTANITVTMGWNPEQPNPGGSGRIITGQMSGTSTGGSIVGYYFVVEYGNGMYVKATSVLNMSKMYTVNSTTGEMTVQLKSLSGSSGVAIYCCAVDENGCEGLGQFVRAEFP